MSEKKDKYEYFSKLKDNGNNAYDICLVAKEKGFSKTEIVKMIRTIFGFYVQEAREVVWQAFGQENNIADCNPYNFLGIDTKEDLYSFLQEELSYCDCSSKETLVTLKETLDIIKTRSEAKADGKDDIVKQKTEELENCIRSEKYFTWFLNLLENRGLIWHGWNTADCYIEEKGIQVLEALKKYEIA